MNLISQGKGFYLETEIEPLSCNAQALWWLLNLIDNECYWKEWIRVDNLRLMSKLRLGEKPLINARNELIAKGYIDYQKGKKGQPSKYKIFDLQEKIGCHFGGKNDREKEINEHFDDVNKIDCRFGGEYDRVNDRVNDRENDSKNDRENDSHNNTEYRIQIHGIKENKKEKSTARFSPPTLDEVTEYVKDNGYNVDPSVFIDYYTSNGWLVGKNKMKDWKATVRRWHSTQNQKSGGNSPPNNKSLPQNGSKTSASYDMELFQTQVSNVPKYEKRGK